MIFQQLHGIQLFIHSLPKLREEVRTYKATTDSQLRALPPRLAQAPSLELLKLISAYTDKLNSIAQGNKGDGELLRKCKPAFGNFRAAVRHTAPRFIPRLAQQSHTSMPSALGANSDEELPEPYSEPPHTPAYLDSNEGQAESEFGFAHHSTASGDIYEQVHSAQDCDVTCEYSEDSDDGEGHESRSKHQLVSYITYVLRAR
jgi:hypothetical protein